MRLVKGAYWDSEIKRAQERGLPGYPVYTRKTNTDVSYLACARNCSSAARAIYPQFATHNAHTVAAIWQLATDTAARSNSSACTAWARSCTRRSSARTSSDVPCRVYAPVGTHEDLLPYLVRRLLENGANTSFVNRIVDEDVPIDATSCADPVARSRRRCRTKRASAHSAAAPALRPDAAELAGRAPCRRFECCAALASDCVTRSRDAPGSAAPLVSRQAAPEGRADRCATRPIAAKSSASCRDADERRTIEAALAAAARAQPAWDARRRASAPRCWRRAADLFEERMPELIAICVREAGKTFRTAIAEVREAVDFLRYYAVARAQTLARRYACPGRPARATSCTLHGRGVFACISPWNFPLAIFTGQVAAALAAGNAVLAKPAEQTPLIAARRPSSCCCEAGVPPDVLHFLPGDGATVGARSSRDPRVAGVAFTGSTETRAADQSRAREPRRSDRRR